MKVCCEIVNSTLELLVTIGNLVTAAAFLQFNHTILTPTVQPCKRTTYNFLQSFTPTSWYFFTHSGVVTVTTIDCMVGAFACATTVIHTCPTVAWRLFSFLCGRISADGWGFHTGFCSRSFVC